MKLKFDQSPAHQKAARKEAVALFAGQENCWMKWGRCPDELKLQQLQLRSERARKQIAAGDTVDGGEFFEQLLHQ